MNYRYAFVGTGKLAKSYLAYFKKKYSRDEFKELLKEILVLGPRETSKLVEFEKDGFSTSHDYNQLKNAECVVVVVTPGALCAILVALRKVVFAENSNQHFIFIVSGASIDLVLETCPNLSEDRVALATGNSNVRYGVGCMSYAIKKQGAINGFVEKSLSVFGFVIEETEKDILAAITTWGADNALNAQALLLLHTDGLNSEGNLQHWLVDVNNYFADRKDFLDPDIATKLEKHINVKAHIFQKRFGGSLKKMLQRVRASFISTVKALVAMGADRYTDLAEHNNRVATPDGSTEKGLRKLVKVDQLLSAEGFEPVISGIADFADTFEATARKSVADAIDTDAAAKKVFRALGSGNALPG